MAVALPQILSQAPPKAALSLKVPAALVPAKGVPTEALHGAAAPKTKFQALLDQLSQAAKAVVEQNSFQPNSADKSKQPKGKSIDAPVEKPKELKEAKDGKKGEAKNGEVDPNLVSMMVPAKLDTTPKPVKAPEAEAVQASTEKSKAPLRDRRTGMELGVPAPVTAAAAEIARSQAQQNAPRSERTEDKQKIFVVDRRTELKEKEKLRLSGAEGAASQPVSAPVELQVQAKTADPKTGTSDIQVTFQTVSGKARDGFDLKPQNTPVSARDAVSFQQYLVERGYGQLVDQARIVLKDQNAGEIRMTLYPESLGKVKVSLNLADNSLAGQIYVENQSVKEVFQNNMDGLLQAFKDGGWNDLSLEVSVGGEGGASKQGNRQPQTAPQARDYDRQVTQAAPVEGRTLGSWNDRQINLTA